MHSETASGKFQRHCRHGALIRFTVTGTANPLLNDGLAPSENEFTRRDGVVDSENGAR